MGIMIGGDKARWSRTIGEIFIAGHYINKRPAMILYPATPRTVGKPTACAIPLDGLYRYTDTAYLVSQARRFVNLMGLSDTPGTTMKVASAIEECMDDLIQMPPEEPSGYEKTVAELIVNINGKTIEREIKE